MVDVELSFPARPEFIRLARLVAADAGARAGFSVDDIDNLRIAVDELTFLLANDSCSETVTLQYDIAPGLIEIRGGRHRGADERGSLEPSDLAQAILQAVIDHYELEAANEHYGYRLVKRSRTPG